MTLNRVATVATLVLLFRAAAQTGAGVWQGVPPGADHLHYWALTYAVVAWFCCSVVTAYSSPVLASCLAAVSAAYANGWGNIDSHRLPLELWLPAVLWLVAGMFTASRAIRWLRVAAWAWCAAIAVALATESLHHDWLWATVLFGSGLALLVILREGQWLLADPRIHALVIALALPFVLGAIHLVLDAASLWGSTDPRNVGSLVNVVAGTAALFVARSAWSERRAGMDARKMIQSAADALNWAVARFTAQVELEGFKLTSEALDYFVEIYSPGAQQATLKPARFVRFQPMFGTVLREKAMLATTMSRHDKTAEPNTITKDHIIAAERIHAFEIMKPCPFCPGLFKGQADEDRAAA